jgi:hypothetical protein
MQNPSDILLEWNSIGEDHTNMDGYGRNTHHHPRFPPIIILAFHQE